MWRRLPGPCRLGCGPQLPGTRELCGHPLFRFNVAAFGFERERFISPKERNSTLNSKLSMASKYFIMEAPSPVVMILDSPRCPKAAVLNLSGTGNWFHRRQLFPRRRGGGFRVIQVHYIYCALYFYYISPTSDHQALDPGGWGLLSSTVGTRACLSMLG